MQYSTRARVKYSCVWRQKGYHVTLKTRYECYVIFTYVLGIPETNLRGLSTRTARKVLKSKLVLLLPPLANNVINLGGKCRRKIQCQDVG